MSKVPEVTEAEKHFDCHDPDEGHTTGYFTTVEGHDTLLDTIERLSKNVKELDIAVGYYMGQMCEEHNGYELRLREAEATMEADKRLIGDLVNHMRWWAAQEDGLPPEVYETFNAAMLRLGWSYSTEVDCAALSTREEAGQ